MQNRRRLAIGWRVMFGWGIVNIAFAIIVPLTTLFVNPAIFAYASEDEQFTGVSWRQLVSFDPDLGFWIGLTMVTMCAMMMGWGVMMVSLARNAYRRGELWAWKALLGAHGLSYIVYGGLLTFLYFSRGLYGLSAVFPSGISLGLPLLILSIVVLIVGLWLPQRELVEVTASRGS